MSTILCFQDRREKIREKKKKRKVKKKNQPTHTDTHLPRGTGRGGESNDMVEGHFPP
jgi:hypothetical protein